MADLLYETDLVAGFVAGVAFLIVMVVVMVPIWLGLGLAVLVYLGMRLVLPSPDEAARAVREGRQRLGALAALIRQVDPRGRPGARKQLEQIVQLAQTDFDLIRKDPKRRGYAQPFLTDYLTPIQSVVTPYVRLAGQGVAPANDDLAEVERDSLPRIVAELTSLRDDLYRTDLTELRVGKELVDMMSLPIVTKNQPGES
jgi:hypothetical protein